MPRDRQEKLIRRILPDKGEEIGVGKPRHLWVTLRNRSQHEPSAHTWGFVTHGLEFDKVCSV